MFEILSASMEKAVEILAGLAYPGALLFSFLDRVTVFLVPAEIVLPAYGILVSQGEMVFWTVFAWITLGSFLGNLVLYFIFLKGGRPFLEKYGRYFLISGHEIGHLDRWSSKYGDKIIIFGYLLPTSIRSLVPILAGLMRTEIKRFSFFTFIMSIPYNLLLIFIGMKAADDFEKILSYFQKFNYVILALIVILAVIYIYKHLRKKHLTHE